MVLGRLPLSVHFMATVVSQLITLNLRVGGEVKFRSLSFYCHLISQSSSWFSHVHSVHNLSFGGTRVSQKKRQLMRSESVWKERGGGGITKYGIHSESF